MIFILLAILAQCGPHQQGIPWYDRCWWDMTDTPKISNLEVMLTDCFRGPGVAVPHGCRQRFDFDHDGDVDLADFAVLQAEGR